LFVGNLPHNAEDKDLADFFSKFGKVIDVKINRKGMQRDLPNFGFVSFENAESVSKALASKPLLLYGRHRLNVEEKKEQSELYNRGRGRGRGGGPYRGSYRGGRGGSHFSSSDTVAGPDDTSH
jgi:RNA recognition motif-containing protein